MLSLKCLRDIQMEIRSRQLVMRDWSSPQRLGLDNLGIMCSEMVTETHDFEGHTKCESVKRKKETAQDQALGYTHS